MHLKQDVLGTVAVASWAFLITDLMAMLSKRRTNTFVFVALLIVALLPEHSQGIMGWFGGKKPNGRRSITKVRYKQNLVGKVRDFLSPNFVQRQGTLLSLSVNRVAV